MATKIPSAALRPEFEPTPYGVRLAKLWLDQNGRTYDLLTTHITEEQAAWVQQYCLLASDVLKLADGPKKTRGYLQEQQYQDAINNL